VLDIENESAEFPWQEEDFLRCLKQRNCIGMVAEHNDQIVGFMIYELHKTRIHLGNFAVRKSHRRLGAGMQMIDKLTSKLTLGRRSCIELEIRETNTPGQLFFRSQGFRAISVLRGIYDDSHEDAYRMVYQLAAVMTERLRPKLKGQ